MVSRTALPSRLNRESRADISSLVGGGGAAQDDAGPVVPGSGEGGGAAAFTEGPAVNAVRPRRSRGFRPRPQGDGDKLKMGIMMPVVLRKAMERASVELEMNFSQLIEEAVVFYLYSQGLSVEGMERPDLVLSVGGGE